MTTLPEDFGVSGRGLAKSASAFDIYRRGVIGQSFKIVCADPGRRAGLL
jgi:hypothetical protein